MSYDAQVSYESLKYATYDREDDSYYNTETVNTIFPESVSISVEVSFVLTRNIDYSLSDASIEDITIDPNNTLGEIIIDTGLNDSYY